MIRFNAIFSCIILMITFIFLINCNKKQTNEPTDNTTLTASFTVNPTLGLTSTIFNFDASGCSDPEDPISSLQVRWDWDNNGTWDTGYSTTKTATHQYSTEGTKTINFEVKNTRGLTDTTTNQVSVSITSTGNVTDIDGNVYQTIIIGNQWWMTENLKVTRYRNGDAIPNITDDSAWSGLTTGAYCNYNNDTNIVATYGRLYNWYAVDDSRNIAPEGWHVPTDDEWKELEMYLGMSQSQANITSWRGTNEGDKLKTTSGWQSSGHGTNSSGFSALPGGARGASIGTFSHTYGWANFWSSTGSGSNAWTRSLAYHYSRVGRHENNKRSGYSVRCIRD